MSFRILHKLTISFTILLPLSNFAWNRNFCYLLGHKSIEPWENQTSGHWLPLHSITCSISVSQTCSCQISSTACISSNKSFADLFFNLLFPIWWVCLISISQFEGEYYMDIWATDCLMLESYAYCQSKLVSLVIILLLSRSQVRIPLEANNSCVGPSP